MSRQKATSTNVFHTTVCETCGQPATHAVRDRVEEPSDSSFRKFIYGPWRFGCDAHRKRRTLKRLDGILEEQD
jgi:hypothetical protein